MTNHTASRPIRLSVLLAASLVAAMPSPAAAQQAQPARWAVDWSEQHCTLVRNSSAAAPTTLYLRTVPGGNSQNLVLVGNPGQALPFANGERVTLSLDSVGAAMEGPVRVGQRPDGRRYVVLDELSSGFLDRLAGAGEIRLSRGAASMAVPVPGARNAVTALRACVDETLRQWGVDERALAALRQRPDAPAWLSLRDRPSRALLSGSSGIIVLRLTVDANGRLTNCTVVGPSGNPVLDRATCATARERARFTPGVDTNGMPVEARIIRTVRWAIED